VSFVLDASVALAWALPDEGGDDVQSLFERLVREGAIVPSLWKLEIGNTLLMAERRGRISGAFRAAAMTDLALLPISIDAHTAANAWRGTMDLAAQHRLSAYDAAYLELALREAIPLATFDAALSRAAVAAGVRVIGTAA